MRGAPDLVLVADVPADPVQASDVVVLEQVLSARGGPEVSSAEDELEAVGVGAAQFEQDAFDLEPELFVQGELEAWSVADGLPAVADAPVPDETEPQDEPVAEDELEAWSAVDELEAWSAAVDALVPALPVLSEQALRELLVYWSVQVELLAEPEVWFVAGEPEVSFEDRHRLHQSHRSEVLPQEHLCGEFSQCRGRESEVLHQDRSLRRAACFRFCSRSTRVCNDGATRTEGNQAQRAAQNPCRG